MLNVEGTIQDAIFLLSLTTQDTAGLLSALTPSEAAKQPTSSLTGGHL